jgi:hypothetical protein
MNTLFDYINLAIQIILAFGVFILFWQIKTQITESRYDRTLDQLQDFENPDFLSTRLFVLREWNGKFPLNRDDELKIRDFAHRMEILGALYLKKFIDRDFIRDMYGPFIVHSWYRCKPFIEKEMKERKVEKYHEHFRIMHLHVMKSFNKKYPNNKISVPENVFQLPHIEPVSKKKAKNN